MQSYPSLLLPPPVRCFDPEHEEGGGGGRSFSRIGGRKTRVKENPPLVPLARGDRKSL